MNMPMKKATNMIEVYEAFETQNPLTEKEREFYVDIYKRDISRLRKDLFLNSIPHKTFFVTGQSGNGKSTALNFLPDEKIRQKYDVKYLNGRDVFKMDDIDVIDVILMIGFIIVQGNETLEKKFLDELEELKKIKLGKLEKTLCSEDKRENEFSAGAGMGAKLPLVKLLNMISFNADIFAKYRVEKDTRNTVREIFTLDKLELIKKINGIIGEYHQEILKDGKKPLLIIDDLEKIRDIAQTQELFVNNSYVFDEIQCVKVITFPIHLATRHALYKDASKFGIRIDNNPLEGNAGTDTVAQENRGKLEEVIRRRLENQELIDENAIREAVTYSGGNLRYLIEIIQKAARNTISMDDDAETLPVMINDVKNAVDEMADLASLSVMSRVGILKQVMDNHREPENGPNDQFVQSILDNTVFAYFNGHPWYSLNPIIRDSVSIYSRNRDSGE